MEMTQRRRKTQVSGDCATVYVDEARVARARAALPDDAVLQRVADFYSALSDPTRLRILVALLGGELCVCDLAKVAERSMGATSHQLQLLRRLTLVKYRMDGKLAYYSLADTRVRSLLADAMDEQGKAA